MLFDLLDYCNIPCEEIIEELSLLYDKERIEYVLAANCFDKANDEHFDKNVVRWGKKIFETLPEFLKVTYLHDNGNPIRMNELINTYITKELDMSREEPKKKNQILSLE